MNPHELATTSMHQIGGGRVPGFNPSQLDTYWPIYAPAHACGKMLTPAPAS
jgi:hypothetical protein